MTAAATTTTTTTTADGGAAALAARFAAIHERLDDLQPAVELAARLQAIAARIAALEAALQLQQAPGASGTADGDAAAGAAAAAAAREASYAAATGAGASAVQRRLARELYDKGFTDYRFVRVPEQYYDEPLEFRRACLQAASTDHLCKSIIMENTRAHGSVDGWRDPHNSKYYVVIVQYTARLHADKLKNAIHKLNGGRIGKQYFNMRLCPEGVSDALSGFEHNAVTPIGIREAALPIVLDHNILNLTPDFFFLGAGEVDLKVGLKASEFLDKYRPIVLDCTYDKE